MEWLANIKRWLAAHRLPLLGFAVSTAYWPGMSSAAVIPRWGVIAVGIPLVSAMDPRGIPESLRWVLAFLLAVAAMATAFASPDAMAGWLEMFFIVLLCLTFIAAARFDSIDGLMTGIGYGLAVSSVLAVAQKCGYDFGLPQSASPSGLFYNREVLAEFAALVVVWAILRERIVIGIIALTPVMLCESRVAAITMVVGLGYAWWPKRWLPRVAVSLLIACAVVGSLVAMGYDKAASADHRLILWTTTIASWTQFGHGLGWFAAAHPAEEFAHSDALQAIAELGIGGLALIAIPFVAFRNSRGGYHVERALFVAICVEAVISFPLHFPASGFLAAVVAGYLAGARDPVRLGEYLGRSEDAGDLQRHRTDDSGDVGIGGRGRGPVPVRPLYPGQAPIYQTTDFSHSTPPGVA